MLIFLSGFSFGCDPHELQGSVLSLLVVDLVAVVNFALLLALDRLPVLDLAPLKLAVLCCVFVVDIVLVVLLDCVPFEFSVNL